MHWYRDAETELVKVAAAIQSQRPLCMEPLVPLAAGLVTALNPYIGYEKSTEIANLALATGDSVYEIVLEKGYLSKARLDEILSPENMTRPRYTK